MQSRKAKNPVIANETDQVSNVSLLAMTQESAGPQIPPGPHPPATVEAWFNALESPLLRYSMKLVQNHETAQDIVQEAFLKLHARFGEIRDPRPWLFRTVHNLALNHLRSGHKIVPLEAPGRESSPPELADDRSLPHQELERHEAVEQTRLCLLGLDDRSRELVQLKFGEGLSYKEISRRTGLSVSNVGYILHHALKNMANVLDQSGVSL